jgi:hypothetical protein
LRSELRAIGVVVLAGLLGVTAPAAADPPPHGALVGVEYGIGGASGTSAEVYDTVGTGGGFTLGGYVSRFALELRVAQAFSPSPREAALDRANTRGHVGLSSLLLRVGVLGSSLGSVEVMGGLGRATVPLLVNPTGEVLAVDNVAGYGPLLGVAIGKPLIAQSIVSLEGRIGFVDWSTHDGEHLVPMENSPPGGLAFERRADPVEGRVFSVTIAVRWFL